MKTKTLDEAVVGLLCEIESLLTRNVRAPEVTEYRRGFQEALTGLKNSVEMIDVVDGLKAVGWQPPRTHWRQTHRTASTSEPAGDST